MGTVNLYSQGADDLPDAGEGMCCDGSAAMGPDRCTCWASEWDQPQADRLQAGPCPSGSPAAADCAFRPGSPEQSGDSRYAYSSEGELDEVLLEDAPFICHQGMRRRLRLVHPSGVEHDAGPGAYDPPQRPGMAWKADGSPAEVCAGWAARRAALLRTE
jgi:hypothetical protein